MSRYDKAVIHIDNMYGFKTRQPYVTLQWGKMKGVLTPSEVRLHAMALIHQAEVAEQDAFMFEFAREDIADNAKITDEKDRDQVGAHLLGRFRDWRNKGRTEE